MRLIILTGETPADPLRYVQVEGGKPVAGGIAQDLAALADKLDETPSHVNVLLPGERFAIRRLSTPARNTNQLLQAARFLLEDELAGPVESLHVAVGGTEGASERPVIAAERAWISDWIAALKEAGFPPDILSADVLALGIEGQGIVLVERDRLSLNLDGEGFVADRPLADDLAAVLIAESGLEGIGIVYGGKLAPFELPEGVQAHAVQLPDPRAIPSFFAGHLGENEPVNLLQGEFEPGIDWGEALRPWRYAAMLAAACLVLWLGVIGLEGASLHRDASRLQSEAEDAFAAAYPDLPRRNINTQARQLAGAVNADESWFLDLSATLAAALEDREGVQLAGLSYDAADQLVADIRFSDTSQLDELKQALSGRGIAVQEGRNLSREGAGTYIGKLYLRVS